ncbi:MAG: hypothetical protein E6G51_01175 [Actinobacteria bacterium]|nr:MAG: hypothetical protein E6G51_01175 [Actinomycetota bacterium]
MSRFLALFTFALLLGGLLISGCGDSSDADPVLLGEAAYVKRATAICEGTEKKELEGAIDYSKEHPSAKAVEMVEPVLLPLLERQGEQMRALGVPSGNEAAVESMMEEFEAALEESKENPQSVAGASTNPFKEYDRLAKEADLVACSHVP